MPERPPRLALCRTPYWDEAEPEGRAVLEDAATRLRAAGAEVIDSELPAECDDIAGIQNRHSAYEAPRNHAPELHRHAALLSDDLLANGRIAAGRKLTTDDFRADWRRADTARARSAGVGRRVRRHSDIAGSRPGPEAVSPAPARRFSTGCGPFSTCRA